MDDYVYTTSARQLTNEIKKLGFEVSISYGRNAGSVVTYRSKGFNVKTKKKLSRIFNDETFCRQYSVTGSNELLQEIRTQLKSKGYITSKVSFNELIVAGEIVRKNKK